MQLSIDRSMPPARGVTHLMYVGDDDAPENAIAECGKRRARTLTPFIIGGAALAIFSTDPGIAKAGAALSLLMFLAI